MGLVKPLYSICMCNYNMSDTIQASIESIQSQISSEYEIVVVDDGSCDGSLDVLNNLSQKYGNMLIIPLLRDRRRSLGETRNISINAASGEYVLLHLDADDVWDPYINTFVQLFHEISIRTAKKNFFLSGNQIQIAPRSLLLDIPYRNLYYGEDKVLWNELAVANKIFFLDHQAFRHRLPLKARKKRYLKNLRSIYSSVYTTYSFHPNPFHIFSSYLTASPLSGFSRLFELFVLPVAFIDSCFVRTQPYVPHFLRNYYNLYSIDLFELEQLTCKEHGKLTLTEAERLIFMPSQ